MKTALILFALILVGCSTSTQTKRDELTTTRQLDTVIQVPTIKTSGQSQNYSEWRKWLLPILEFAPDTQSTARFVTEDSSASVSLNLKTGKIKVAVKPPPVKARINETTSRVKEEREKEYESIFEKPLMWLAIILLVLLAGFIAYKVMG